jgi:LDH2 family malate/lactate/ureidoglycolate dehydrogenase
MAQSSDPVRVRYENLLSFTTTVFTERGVPPDRARTAATALCYGDLTGHDSHGVVNLTRLYLPLSDDGRVDPVATPEIRTDLGACVLMDAHRALGLWAATEAMERAVERARRYGIGLVSVRGGTHFGCAGGHAALASDHGMIGLVTSNCGGQRIAPPPGGTLAMLGTNPLSVAAPAMEGHPFILDMSTTVVPTGRVRAAARAGQPIPEGWLEDGSGRPVTDPGAWDRREAQLRWLGGDSQYKGFGLGIVVEVLSALLSGSAVGPAPAALDGDGGPHGRDDDIGYLVAALAPDQLRPGDGFSGDAQALFATLLACPARNAAEPVRYPGWPEAERAAAYRREGIPISPDLYEELTSLGFVAQPHAVGSGV